MYNSKADVFKAARA